MNGIIVYKGKYGATWQYAEWAGQELNMPVLMSENCKEDKVQESDFLVVGTSVYIGSLVIKQWLHDNVRNIGQKQIFLFIVCGTPANEKQKLEGYIQSSVPKEIINQCTCFFLPGRLAYKKLSRMDKFLLRLGALLPSNRNKNKTIMEDYDSVKQENLIPLVSAVRTHVNNTPITAVVQPL